MPDPDTYWIKNERGATLPATGGSGTTVFYILGTMLTTFAGAGIVMTKRKKTNIA